jgi:hypothetical protein
MLRKRSTYVIGGAILLAFIVGFLVGGWNAEPTETNIPAELFEQSSLLTWKGWSGDICFLLIPRIERGPAFHDLTSKWARTMWYFQAQGGLGCPAEGYFRRVERLATEIYVS